ncbi:MAG: tRNA 2-selenouridine(34) synthase MnmH [Oceanicaulis sp.]
MKISFADYETAAAEFDTVIDVRSPSEFAEDRLPGAVNMAVLDDAERAKVGTIYVQESPFLARKVGAAIIARNTAGWLDSALAGMEGGWKPLVYCWRGGGRSGAFSTILRAIGWRVTVLEGGYKAYRGAVVKTLYDDAVRLRVVLLDGDTGTAKTALLDRLATRGVQTLDLEAAANHRGSLFGWRPGGQPSQKLFETRLREALSRFDPAKPVLVEAESARIGALKLPPSLWAVMKDAPRLVVKAPLEARAAFLASAYADIAEDTPRLIERLQALKPFQGGERIARWEGLAKAGEIETLAGELMERHYDPAYARERSRHDRPALAELDAARLDADGLDALAAAIEAELDRL